MKNIILTLAILSVSLFSKEYTLNVQGTQEETMKLVLNLETEESGKIRANQRVDVRNNPNFKSLKVLVASGLKGTLKDEREVIIFYKTSLEVSGLKIRNLYKVALARVYGDESTIEIAFDKDHYQNIISFLRYHNIKQEVINDINNMYGTWTEIE